MKIKFDEEFFFAVDCNEKKVFHSSNLPKDNEIRSSSELSDNEDGPALNDDVDNTEKQSGFFLFNFNSAHVERLSKSQVLLVSLFAIILKFF